MKTVGIIGGTGAMGSLFSKFFQNAGFKVLISGRKTALSSKELCAQSDWIIFCVPIPATERAIAENSKFAKKGAIISDFTSIKQEPLKAMLKHCRKDCEIVGIHPLFGPSANSLKNQKIALVKGRGKKGFAFVKKFFESQNAKVFALSARKHDELMAVIQGANHFDNLSFALSLAGSKLSMKDLEMLATPNFRLKLALVARILQQNPGLYADLILENKQALKSIKAFAQSVKVLERIAEQKDNKALEKVLQKISKKFGKSPKRLFEESNLALNAMQK